MLYLLFSRTQFDRNSPLLSGYFWPSLETLYMVLSMWRLNPSLLLPRVYRVFLVLLIPLVALLLLMWSMCRIGLCSSTWILMDYSLASSAIHEFELNMGFIKSIWLLWGILINILWCVRYTSFLTLHMMAKGSEVKDLHRCFSILNVLNVLPNQRWKSITKANFFGENFIIAGCSLQSITCLNSPAKESMLL